MKDRSLLNNLEINIKLLLRPQCKHLARFDYGYTGFSEPIMAISTHSVKLDCSLLLLSGVCKVEIIGFFVNVVCKLLYILT